MKIAEILKGERLEIKLRMPLESQFCYYERNLARILP